MPSRQRQSQSHIPIQNSPISSYHVRALFIGFCALESHRLYPEQYTERPRLISSTRNFLARYRAYRIQHRNRNNDLYQLIQRVRNLIVMNQSQANSAIEAIILQAVYDLLD